jgi:hypothetical protein
MMEEFKKNIPLNLLEIKETYKKMRKSESDLYST